MPKVDRLRSARGKPRLEHAQCADVLRPLICALARTASVKALPNP
jgi:hypothetical protein